jgi:TPR repeat protein
MPKLIDNVMHRTLRALPIFILLAVAGFAADTPLVAEWRKKAEAGDAKFQEIMGECYYDASSSFGVPKDYAEAVKWYRLAAEQGNVFAQYELGRMYHNGTGVPKDYAEAAKWWRLAAEQGNAGAQSNLGVFYANGVGVPKDSAEAVKWYRKAAEQGLAMAQTNLGAMYYDGEGVPKDLVQAHVWWNIAGAKGHEDAKKNLAIVEKKMTDAQKAESMKLVRTLFSKLQLPEGEVSGR